MAQTLVDHLSHVVFSTKRRERIILPEIETRLFTYMSGTARNLGCPCLAINGTEDHLHLLVSLSKTLALSAFVRELKSAASRWVKSTYSACGAFAWQDGYGSFSVSRSVAPAVIRYIERQKEHHRRMSFEDEYLGLVRKHGLEFDERYLFD